MTATLLENFSAKCQGPSKLAERSQSLLVESWRLSYPRQPSRRWTDWLRQHRDLVPPDESKTKDIFARYAAEHKKLTDSDQARIRAYAMAMWDGTRPRTKC